MGRRLGYSPKPVAELLRELKDLSQLIMSLSYCSLFFGDPSLYREISHLDDRVDYLRSLLIMQAALATRDREDAERMLSVFDMASAVDKISEVAKDISELTHDRLRIELGDYVMRNSRTNFVYTLRITGDSPFKDGSIERAYDIVGEIFDVVAIRRGDDYILSPGEDVVLREGDVIYIKGLAETIRRIISMHGERGGGGVRLDPEKLEGILYVKNLSEFMVDLAYGALFTGSEELAQELESLEDGIDQVTKDLKTGVIADSGISDKEKLALIEFIDSCEYLGDAALDMTYSLRMGIPPHPIIETILETTDERYRLLRIPRELAGKELADLGLTKLGVDILAIKVGGYWYLNPPVKGYRLRGDEQIVIQYFEEAEDEVAQLVERLGLSQPPRQA